MFAKIAAAATVLSGLGWYGHSINDTWHGRSWFYNHPSRVYGIPADPSPAPYYGPQKPATVPSALVVTLPEPVAHDGPCGDRGFEVLSGSPKGRGCFNGR